MITISDLISFLKEYEDVWYAYVETTMVYPIMDVSGTLRNEADDFGFDFSGDKWGKLTEASDRFA